ncbi:MAG: AMP-binding protein [Cyclobacteriaceae bacterium]
MQFILDWIDGKDSFQFNTSGSTGQRKSINLSRSQLKYSAEVTLNYIDPDHHFASSLLCINPRFIGGTMVIIRALVGKMQLHIQKASSLPSIDTAIDLISMVPLQVDSLLKNCPEKFEHINTLIIGGAAISENSLDQLRAISSLNTYTSYGMTETASHIALRHITENTGFKLLGDIKATIVDSKLNLQGSATNQLKICTNDIIEFITNDTFVYKGRIDNVINSGGYKIFPEEVESILRSFFDFPFFIAGVNDEYLGEKVVLLAQTKNNLELSEEIKMKLHRYQVPKEIILLSRFEYTETEKINRKATLKKIGF